MSQINVPPWCSSGRIYERRRPRKLSHRELKSSHPLREDIWEYLNNETIIKRKDKKCSPNSKARRGKSKLFIFLLLIIGSTISYIYCDKIQMNKLFEKLISQANISWGEYIQTVIKVNKHASVDEECCYRMKYLSSKLIQSENLLRTTLRMRRTMFTSQSYGAANNRNAIGSYIAGAQAVKGSSTTTWGGRVALWGVIPLWRAAPPPDTILALRKPTPSDCWPFSGSSGEVIIHLPNSGRVDSISLEHIRPDTALSAPKDFVVHGILENGTRIKATAGTYRYNKPAKQYYPLDNRSAPLKHIVFRILSNHGNPKYTCVYRIHLYNNLSNKSGST